MTIKALQRVAKMTQKIFGEPAVFLDKDQVEFSCRVIFNSAHVELDFDGIPLEDARPVAIAHVSDDLDRAEYLKIGGSTYKISSKKLDGYGLSKLELDELGEDE